ncbi:MAG TPA: hypothetical protein VI233_03390 [Puia sp.]
MKKSFFLFCSLLVVLASCKKNNDGGKDNFFKGPEQQFQGGKAWTWLQTDKDGKPEKIAIAMDDAAYTHLDPGAHPEHEMSDEASLKFPAKASITPFSHALLEWNPHGHEPPGIYDKPHFDFHFYIQSEAERLKIPFYEDDSAKFLNFPTPGYMPSTYVPSPGGVPQMGTHWVDINAPELNGQPFTQTYLYGSYDGKLTFYEPMITKAFLDANTSFERPFPQPAKFRSSGYFPTIMQVKKENGTINIILTGFIYRQAS